MNINNKKYDLVVVGGGAAGCAAAFIAAKNGLKTLIVEKNIHLGGSITSGLVVPAMKTSENQINTDFFEILISELQKMHGQITYHNNPGWFNPELTKIALETILTNAGADILFDTTINNVEILNSIIKKVYLYSNLLSVPIETKYVLDATGNCDVGKILKCNFLEKENELQPVSLRFEMSGIDMEKFAKWVTEYDTNTDVTSCIKINNEWHLSTAYTDCGDWGLAPLFKNAIKDGILEPNDCKYFQVFTIPNAPSSLNFNCPRVYSVPEINPLNPLEISNALICARKSVLRIAEFCKKYFKGFEHAYISNIADALGVRVSRRIKGEYVYTADDLKTGRKFKNPVLVGNYPIDIHSNKDGESVLEQIMQDYELPVEALHSADIDNLYVAGRCLSADFEAQAALRIQPACFSMGEGVAKHIIKLCNM